MSRYAEQSKLTKWSFPLLRRTSGCAGLQWRPVTLLPFLCIRIGCPILSFDRLSSLQEIRCKTRTYNSQQNAKYSTWGRNKMDYVKYDNNIKRSLNHIWDMTEYSNIVNSDIKYKNAWEVNSSKEAAYTWPKMLLISNNVSNNLYGYSYSQIKKPKTICHQKKAFLRV
jgi:hypothetical protein